jgi:hypothetical protein
LQSASLAHNANWYPSIALAYFGIQFRAFTALLGAISLAVEGFLEYTVDILRSQPGASKFDGRSVRQEHQVAWVFMTKTVLVRNVGRLIGVLVQAVFAVGLCLDIYSAYQKYLDFTLFAVGGSVVGFVSAASILFIFREGTKAQNSMGYRSLGILCNTQGALNDSAWGTTLTYQSGLTYPAGVGAGAAAGGGAGFAGGGATCTYGYSR